MSGLVLAGWSELVRKPVEIGVPTGGGGLLFPQRFLFPKISWVKSKDVYELHNKPVSHWSGGRRTDGA
jgi:hypothetical protein